MKKLMIMAMVAVIAGFANAAAVTWQSGNVYAPNSDGSFGDKLGTSTAANLYLFVIADADAYDSVQDAGAWATYGADLTKATASATGTTSSKFADITTEGYTAGSTVYAAVITTYKEGDKTWYTENYVAVEIDSLGTDATASNLSRYVGGDRAGGNLTWQSVPEPTSGLLMLVGLAGLALRRRRA